MMDSAAVIVGIDLGTTHSAVGVVDSGFPLLFADEEGERIIPSAVWYGEDGEILVGKQALARRDSSDGRLITSVKRLMGGRFEENDSFHLPVLRDSQGRTAIPVPGKAVLPEEVSAEILKVLKATAEKRMGHEVTRAVITVPAYFNDAQRSATVKAGELAGLIVERVVSEPTAAALHYGLNQLAEESYVVVYDLGGGTFDVSVLKLKDGVYEVLATCGDTHLGGDDLDHLLATYLWTQVGQDDWADLNEQEASRWMAEARRLKHQLSEQDEVTWEKGEVSTVVNLEIFNDLVSETLDKTVVLCRKALSDAQLVDLSQIDEVILVGGSTRVPAVQQLVEEVFEQKPNLTQHPDEAIALGAAVQAGVLSGAVGEVVLLDVTPLSLGIETYGGLMNVLIPRNTTIPCKAGEMFTNATAGQSAMAIRILQGEREMARDNWELGRFDLKFESLEKGQARVGVQFTLNENGILEVLARDVSTGVDTVIQIDSAAVDVSDEDVGTMVEESVEHAFTDMGERIFTEARLKAEELLPAIDMALEQVGGLIDLEEVEEIQELAKSVRQTLTGNDHVELKAQVRELDKKTETLAAALLERALESDVL